MMSLRFHSFSPPIVTLLPLPALRHAEQTPEFAARCRDARKRHARARRLPRRCSNDRALKRLTRKT
jgi:hypothetical protein